MSVNVGQTVIARSARQLPLEARSCVQDPERPTAATWSERPRKVFVEPKPEATEDARMETRSIPSGEDSDGEVDCDDYAMVCRTATTRTEFSDWGDFSSESGSPVSRQITWNADFAHSWTLREPEASDEEGAARVTAAAAVVDIRAACLGAEEAELAADDLAADISPPSLVRLPMSDALFGVLEEEIPRWVLCSEAPALAATCRTFRERFGTGFWQHRLSALPEAMLREARLVLPGALCAPSRPRPPLVLAPRRIAALEARSLRSPEELTELDRLLCLAARAGAHCAPLLLRGASSNARLNGSPALALAVASGSEAAARALLQHDANLEAVDKDGDRPLAVAVLNRHLTLVRLLLASGASPDEPDGNGDTPLICATVSGQAGIVEALIEGGADVEAVDNDGDTPVICAAVNDRADVIRALVLGGADLEAPDEAGGDVPLVRAAMYGHCAAVQALLECRARLDVTDSEGRSVHQIAQENGHDDVVRLLMACEWAA